MASVPAARKLPEIAHWLWVRNIDTRSAAAILGCSRTTVANICRAFDDPMRRTPKGDLLAAIVRLTAGEITAEHFYPIELRRPVAEAHQPEPVQ